MSRLAVSGFAAVRGHERVCERLRTAAAAERLAHALLFAGPDGIGKRGVALALAAWQQCEHAGDDACGSCGSCRQIAVESHPDFQLIAVASGKKEIGIERARHVKRFVQLQPMRGKVKIAVIDDAHMLTVAAQNALLKTLEEPPEHSLLILIANNPDALLPTVRSRCQRVQFAPLPAETVGEILIERAGLDATAAAELAALAEGSPGRALALSQGLGGDDSEALASQLAGLHQARYVRVVQLATELNRPETHAAVKIEMLLSHYRDDAVRAVGAAHLALRRQVAPVAATDLRSAMRRTDAVHKAWEGLRWGNPNRQLLLEALLLRLARA